MDGSAVYVQWVKCVWECSLQWLSALLGGTRVEATGEVEVPSCTSKCIPATEPTTFRCSIHWGRAIQTLSPLGFHFGTPVFQGVPPLQDTITLSSSKFPRIPRVSLKMRKPWVKFPKDAYPWNGQALAD